MKEKDDKDFVYTILYIIFMTIIIISALYIFKFYKMSNEATEESQLLNEIDLETQEKANNSSNDIETKNNEADGNASKNIENNNIETTERMLKVKKLQKENDDIVGWLEIEDTNINYPVLQGDDNEFYLNRNYKKEKSEKGSIFLDAKYNWNIQSNNLLIYGHNIINGLMFQDLLKYESQDFYKKHPNIRFTTEKDDKEYEIISVFKSRVYYKAEKNVFRYYDFINVETENEYMDFVKNAKKASIYDIEVTAKYGDELITLVTCSYHIEDGRFVVIGREK